MNDRKQHVIKMAHQLFIDKGFQNTSIQDILDYSGISKGTFYNYFSSKNELLVTLFKTIYKRLEKERNGLLIGQDPSNIEIFIKQIEYQMKTNRANKLMTLFEEVLVLNDADLKPFIKQGQLRMLHWLFRRFIDIFGESRKPYLLDCAIMFMGIIHHNLKYQAMAYDSNASMHQVVRYSVERTVKMVDEVSEAGDQLIQPEFLDRWLPDSKNTDPAFQQELYHTVLALKKAVNHNREQSNYLELLDFVQDELSNSKNPRKFLVKSALLSLKEGQETFEKKELQKLDQLVATFFTQKAETD
ncbi:TetR/AcrR family transcriptional regulator [Peribacillus cavernae]|uniref:TetR/AcrR family transcriptional regulator n=1 Tax=Peribacillus cavernae TaxID=1674310 RepID=A0A3S0U9P0_9BACI|nr:TetR/AcrR family transcriptional regulator [Peribacillus cavernae]MDQ0219768.1 AcrR family transcriptional regulator [Peribacillus cavernae]RUQ25184.1 TetR/AcrR family transcriptional regulator [Peribacillus cavernae]